METSEILFTTSLFSSKPGNIFLILETNIDGLRDSPSISDDEYDKYISFSAVVNALYILKLSS